MKRMKRGNCYENAFILMMSAAPPGADVRLVQGIGVCTGTPKVEMGHAWVEYEINGQIFCRDGACPNSFVPMERYYTVGQISYTVKYTRLEAHKMALKTGRYGPWDEKVNAAAHAND